MQMQNKFIKNKGFTIVETMVAISILAIALTGPLSIVAQSLRSSYFARDQITAHYLAQEAIEYIRNRRDQNGLQQISSDNWLEGIKTSADGYALLNEYNGSNILKANLVRTTNGYDLKKCTESGDEVCPRLKFNPSDANRIYGDDSLGTAGADSIFTREVTLMKTPQDPDAKKEIIVSVKVSWSTVTIHNSVTIDEHLYNWQLEAPQTTQ